MSDAAAVNISLAETTARRFGVSSTIHPDDLIYQYIAKHPVFKTDAERFGYYFGDGAKSARQFGEIVKAFALNGNPSVFEFASGYGCVSRHLANIENIELVSCDIHAQAIDFLERELNVKAVQSASIPERMYPGKQFDIVFALSFFSHMPITTWARWLVRLCQVTAPGGIVAFTTQGFTSMPRLGCKEMPALGFWFNRRSEQHDIPLDEYGATIVAPELVKRHIATISDMEMLELREGYWWGVQDLYILRKSRTALAGHVL